MRQEHAELVLIEQLEGGGVYHDEWGIDPIGPGIEERGLRDIQFGYGWPVEGGGDFGVLLPEPGELGRPDANRVPLKQETNATLAAQHRQDLADQLVHAGNRP